MGLGIVLFEVIYMRDFACPSNLVAASRWENHNLGVIFHGKVLSAGVNS